MVSQIKKYELINQFCKYITKKIEDSIYNENNLLEKLNLFTARNKKFDRIFLDNISDPDYVLNCSNAGEKGFIKKNFLLNLSCLYFLLDVNEEVIDGTRELDSDFRYPPSSDIEEINVDVEGGLLKIIDQLNIDSSVGGTLESSSMSSEVYQRKKYVNYNYTGDELLEIQNIIDKITTFLS